MTDSMRRLHAFTAAVVLFAVACTVSALAGWHPPAAIAPPPYTATLED